MCPAGAWTQQVAHASSRIHERRGIHWQQSEAHDRVCGLVSCPSPGPPRHTPPQSLRLEASSPPPAIAHPRSRALPTGLRLNRYPPKLVSLRSRHSVVTDWPSDPRNNWHTEQVICIHMHHPSSIFTSRADSAGRFMHLRPDFRPADAADSVTSNHAGLRISMHPGNIRSSA